MADETEQMIWQRDVWRGRFVHRSYCRYTTGHSPFGCGSIQAISLTELRNLVWIAGLGPAGAEPSGRTVVSKCDQELRAQLGARPADPEQQRRFARLVSLVKKAYELDDGETCSYRSDPGVTTDVVNPSRHNAADATIRRRGETMHCCLRVTCLSARSSKQLSPMCLRSVSACAAQEGTSDELCAPRQETAHRNQKREVCESRLVVSRSPVIREEFLPVWHGHAQQPGCDAIQPVVGPCLSSRRLEDVDDYWEAWCQSWSETIGLVSCDENKRDYKDYVEMLIARDMLDKNAMTTAYNKLYCGFLSALFESSFLEEKDPTTRSNTCKDRFQSTVLTQDVFFSCSSLSGPSNLHTSPKIRRRQSEQQSHEKFVGIENNTEVNDDVLEENYSTVYVKTINRKTISISYYGNMKAAVMLEEVERRTTIPRDMTRLIH